MQYMEIDANILLASVHMRIQSTYRVELLVIAKQKAKQIRCRNINHIRKPKPREQAGKDG